jgi:hypothetical protein
MMLWLWCCLFLAPATTSAPAAATFTVDTSGAPDLAEYGEKVKALAELWYPKLEAMLPSDGYTAPRKIRLVIMEKDGVAEASGAEIRCSAKWLREHPDDIGLFVHELTHVVQHYPNRACPGWITEGIADYTRWFVYEKLPERRVPKAAAAKHDASYSTSAHFIDWCQRTYDGDLVKKLNAAAREKRYTEAFWKETTGKTLSELSAEWKASLK